MELTKEQLIKHYNRCIESKINLIHYYEDNDILEKWKIIKVLENEIVRMSQKLDLLEVK